MSEERKQTPPPAPPPSPGSGDTSQRTSATDSSRGDRADTSRPAGDDTSRVDGIDRVEFRRGLNDLHRAVKTEGRNTRQFIGWFVATVALLALLLGLYCMYSEDGGWS